MPKLSSSSPSYSHHLGLLPLWLLRAAKMKGKASRFLKQVLSQLASILKAKSAAVKSKTSAVKTRLIIFSLLHKKKVLMGAISDKILALIPLDDSKLIVQYNASTTSEAPPEMAASSGGELMTEEEEEEDDYPDLRHSLFDDEDGDLGDVGTGSVIDLVRNSRREDQGEFVLENEIDRVAELFIKRFHTQMRMQRLESFKRHQEMLAGEKCLIEESRAMSCCP